MQEPPFTLDRMHASLGKQIASNRRVLKAEDEILWINSGIGDFLNEMSFDDAEPLFVCVAVGHTMRGTQSIGGQLWTQALDK
jgi:hypothetical protein